MTVAANNALTPGQQALRTGIQKVATGPEYSKDLSLEEAYAAMRQILAEDADPVQAAVFFIALRMKRETDEENKGVLKAIQETAQIVTAPVDQVLDIGDPYDGHARGLPMAAFLPAVTAALGIPTISHGVDIMGPKYGVTQHKILNVLGKAVNLSPTLAAARLAADGCGWSYLDQSQFAPRLYNLHGVRTRMIKRQVLTTVEVLVAPVRGRQQTHLLTGYVHKAYPPIYSELARFAGFDSAMVVRGVEGGVIPSLQQPAKLYQYFNKGQEQEEEIDPRALGIVQETRAVPLPKSILAAQQTDQDMVNDFDVNEIAVHAAEAGMAALRGQAGPARDSLVYSAALCLRHLGRAKDLQTGAEMARQVLDSGKVLAHFTAG